MRRGVCLLAVLVSLAGAGEAGAACPTPRGYRVVDRSSEAVVFMRADARRAYGCLRRIGRRVPLDPANEGYWLAGRFVAYSTSFFAGEGDELFVLFVVDLQDEREPATAAPWIEQGGERSPEEGASRPSAVTDLTLKRNGSVAWIACATVINDTRCDRNEPEQVRRSDRRGVRLLDESLAIAPRSLTRRESTIHWTSGERQRSATLK